MKVLLLVFAFGQAEPVIVQEYLTLNHCDSKANYINKEKNNYSAICVTKLAQN